jgi:adenylate cyclase
VDVTAWSEAGLYDANAPDAADRLGFLRHLADRGFTIEEMVAADRDGRLNVLALERLIRDTMQGLTLEAASQRAGISRELVERAQRAIGLPPSDDPVYSENALAAFAAAVAFFGPDVALQFSRVMGSSIARIVDAGVSLFVSGLAGGGTTPLEISTHSEDAAQLLLALPETIEALFPSFVNDAVRRLQLTPPSQGAAPIAIGFVDLVGSTRLVQQLSGPELAQAVGEFETAAYDLAVANDGRVVKFIGDAAMFVAPEPAAACAIGLGLCAAGAAHPLLHGAHGAVGWGEALAQGGDFYGPMVTLVSRLSGIAGPDTLLGTAPLAAALVDGGAPYDVTPAGSQRLRGFADPVEVFTVRDAG